MPARSGGRKPPGTSPRKSTGRRAAPAAPRAKGGAGPRPGAPPRRALPVFVDAPGEPDAVALGFAPDHRPPFRTESSAGLRNEIADLRAEVQRLAAEIDKLWARDRGRSSAGGAGRTARSIAGKPIRTGTRAARPAGERAAGTSPGTVARAPRAPSRPAGTPTRRTATAGKRAGSPGGVKRGPGWAKASPPRAKGAGTKRRGR